MVTSSGSSCSPTPSEPKFEWDPILPPLPEDGEWDAQDAANLEPAAVDEVDQPLMTSQADFPVKKARPDGAFGFKGGRKSAKAYVTLKPALPGTKAADFLINGQPVADYFHTLEARCAATAPVILTSTHADFVIRAKVSGGGMQGQAEAIRQAVAHGIRYFKPEYRRLLRSAGFVTRDRRVVERKKPGRKKARKVKTKPYR